MRYTDVLIIGAGAAGLSVAFTAKGFGKSVLMIDRNEPGGECTWSGCIPSKAFIHKASEIYNVKKYVDFEYNTSEVMEYVQKVISKVSSHESIDVLSHNGIDFIKGEARFKSKNVVEVNGQFISGKKIFICTGSSPLIPSISGLNDIEYLTNNSFFKQKSLPKSMIVIGGGAIGVELSQAMSRLGVKVHIIEMADSILPREDAEFTVLLTKRLIDEGVNILTRSKVVKTNRSQIGVSVSFENEHGQNEIEAERLFLALGRIPNVNHLNLDAVNIKYDRKGIQVNQTLETSVKNIYAVGDVVGPYLFSHFANVQGITAVQNAFLPWKKRIDYTKAVWCTFSSPELASLGMNEDEATKKYGKSIKVQRYDLGQLDRQKTKNEEMGMIKVILDKRNRILGCTILSERAGELISEMVVLKTFGIKFDKLASMIYPYPTYAEVFGKMGKAVLVDKIKNNPIVKLLTKNM
jgi:pyruvate/2-oxoglutarate dehydrogenase complex dihydrolipoamide dehydrogenase (E3) component